MSLKTNVLVFAAYLTLLNQFVESLSIPGVTKNESCRCSVSSGDGRNLELYRKELILPALDPPTQLTCSELRQLCEQICADNLTTLFDSHEGRSLAATYKDQLAGVFFCQKYTEAASTFTAARLTRKQQQQLTSVSWVIGCPQATFTRWKRDLCCGRELLPGYRRHYCPPDLPDCKVVPLASKGPRGQDLEGKMEGMVIGWYADCNINDFFAHV